MLFLLAVRVFALLLIAESKAERLPLSLLEEGIRVRLQELNGLRITRFKDTFSVLRHGYLLLARRGFPHLCMFSVPRNYVKSVDVGIFHIRK